MWHTTQSMSTCSCAWKDELDTSLCNTPSAGMACVLIVPAKIVEPRGSHQGLPLQSKQQGPANAGPFVCMAEGEGWMAHIPVRHPFGAHCVRPILFRPKLSNRGVLTKASPSNPNNRGLHSQAPVVWMAEGEGLLASLARLGCSAASWSNLDCPIPGVRIRPALNHAKGATTGPFCMIGGGRGIRTPGGLRLNGFQDRRFRPLSHPSDGGKRANIPENPVSGQP